MQIQKKETVGVTFFPKPVSDSSSIRDVFTRKLCHMKNTNANANKKVKLASLPKLQIKYVQA